jgi:hypothetical protein
MAMRYAEIENVVSNYLMFDEGPRDMCVLGSFGLKWDNDKMVSRLLKRRWSGGRFPDIKVGEILITRCTFVNFLRSDETREGRAGQGEDNICEE